jgi:hypothetical protein
MIQLRPHLDDFEGSTRRVVYLTNGDADDVLAYIRSHFPQWRPDLRYLMQIHCGIDKRNGWDTWVIKLRNHPVVWTDGPVAGVPRLEVVGSSPNRS